MDCNNLCFHSKETCEYCKNSIYYSQIVWKVTDIEVNDVNTRYPNGESMIEFYQRVKESMIYLENDKMSPTSIFCFIVSILRLYNVGSDFVILITSSFV